MRLRYDFFRKELDEERQVRGEFTKIFDEMLKVPVK